MTRECIVDHLSLVYLSVNLSLLSLSFYRFHSFTPSTSSSYSLPEHSGEGHISSDYFEWNPATLKGNGVRDFGRMIAESGQFPRCMARHVFSTVCKREPQSFDEDMIRQVAKEFQGAGQFKMEWLFRKIAITPNCIGEEK